MNQPDLFTEITKLREDFRAVLTGMRGALTLTMLVIISLNLFVLTTMPSSESLFKDMMGGHPFSPATALAFNYGLQCRVEFLILNVILPLAALVYLWRTSFIRRAMVLNAALCAGLFIQWIFLTNAMATPYREWIRQMANY